jgi:putative hemolysin
MQVLFVVILVILNGVFAMAEIAILSSRKNKLQQMAQRGQRGAQTALELLKNPSEFLSSVQVGITLIGIMLGALAEPAIGNVLRPYLLQIPVVGQYIAQLTFLIVIVSITYLSIVIGELVPKRVAVSHPEPLAIVLAPFMKAVAAVAEPFVIVLSRSTEAIFTLLRLKTPNDTPVTEEEVRMLIREGAQLGVFNKTERDLVERALRLDDMKVSSLMKPRNEIESVDVGEFTRSPLKHLENYKYEYVILVQKTLDKPNGVIYLKNLLKEYAATEKFNIKKHTQKVLLVPESMKALRVLEVFRNSPMHVALVIDEYGSVQGLVTFNDILRALVGEIVSHDKEGDPQIVKRSDGSFLLDGMISVALLKKTLDVKSLPKEESGAYQTLGGFVLTYLDKVPKSGDKFVWDGFNFEVVDMDQHRVDKVIVSRKKRKFVRL